MKSLALLLVAAAITQASVLPQTNVAGYLKKSVAIGEKMREREEAFLNKRIVGGAPAAENEIPFQAGLISDILGIQGNGVCGGSLISANRVVTAAHCWFDGQNQAWRLTVVLGSTLLFSGGQRIQTSDVATHPNWLPILVRNDIAVIYLTSDAVLSNAVTPIALPSGGLLNENLAGESAVASGFGLTSDNAAISIDQFLSHVTLTVIPNGVCRPVFPLLLQDSNICTSGFFDVGPCRGDSGGPLFITRDGEPVLIGVTSFGSTYDCDDNVPYAYARVTSYMDFFNQHLQ